MKTLPIVEYPKVVEEFLPNFADLFSKPQLRHLAQYLTGLILCDNKTVSGINDAFYGHRDQSTKNHFLTEAGWPDDQVDIVRMNLITEHVNQRHIQDGCLIVDDSLAHKTGKHIDGVGWHYDHSQDKIVLGHQLVSTHYYCRSFHVPLHFEVYRKDEGFTKNQLARTLIDRAVATKLPFSVVLLDSWYFNKENTDHIGKHHRDWIAACKSNRLVDWKGHGVALADVIKEAPREAFRKMALRNGAVYWVYSKVLTLKTQGRVRIVITRQREDLSDDPNYFATNRVEWDPTRILNLYCCRWTIETFYRDAKQNLGLEACELRIWEGIKRHFQLVFLAFTLLQLSSLNRGLGKWLSANLRTIGGKCQLAAVEILRAFIVFVARETSRQRSADEIVELCFRPAAQLRFSFA